MSNSLDVTVILDNPTRRFSFGEVISGHVLVEVHQPKNYGDMTVNHYAHTHGKGTDEEKEIESVTVHLGRLEVGSYEFDFDFVTAKSPATYHGKIVNLEWCIEAKIKQSILKSYKHRLEFVLEPPAHSRSQRIERIAPTTLDVEETATNHHPLNVFTVLFSIIIGSFLLFIIFGTPEEGSIGGQLIVFGMASIWFGVIMPKRFISYRSANFLEQARLIVDNLPIENQSHMTVKVAIQLKAKMIVTKIVVSLATGEIVKNTSGSTTFTYHDSVDITEAQIIPNQEVPANEVYTSDPISLEIPNEWPAVFEWKNNKTFHQLRFAVHSGKHVYEYDRRLVLKPVLKQALSSDLKTHPA